MSAKSKVRCQVTSWKKSNSSNVQSYRHCTGGYLLFFGHQPGNKLCRNGSALYSLCVLLSIHPYYFPNSFPPVFSLSFIRTFFFIDCLVENIHSVSQSISLLINLLLHHLHMRMFDIYRPLTYLYNYFPLFCFSDPSLLDSGITAKVQASRIRSTPIRSLCARLTWSPCMAWC